MTTEDTGLHTGVFMLPLFGRRESLYVLKSLVQFGLFALHLAQFPPEFVHCSEGVVLTDAIADADIYMGWLGRDAFLTARNLKWIQSPSSGINYYLGEFSLQLGKPVLQSHGVGPHQNFHLWFSFFADEIISSAAQLLTSLQVQHG